MITLIHFPMNNAELDAGEDDLRVLMDVVLRQVAAPHLCLGPVHLRLHLSRPSAGIRASLASAGGWVRTTEVRSRRFDQARADRQAAAMARRLRAGVVCVRAVPRGLLSDRELTAFGERIESAWGAGFVYEVPLPRWVAVAEGDIVL